MRLQGYMKGAAPVRTLLLAALLFMGFTYGMMGWIGSFSATNKIAINPKIADIYSNISQNISYPDSGVFATSKLNTSVKTVVTGLSNPLNLFATAGALGAIGNTLLSIPNSLYIFLTLLGTPFLALGIPVTYLWLLGVLIITMLIALGILSALFIFNI